MTIYLYEFLYRGRPADHPEPPAYHVILAGVTIDAFNLAHTNVGPAMTPEQAAAKGFDLPALVKEINAGVMAENVSLRAARDDLQQKHDQLVSENATLQLALADKKIPQGKPRVA